MITFWVKCLLIVTCTDYFNILLHGQVYNLVKLIFFLQLLISFLVSTKIFYKFTIWLWHIFIPLFFIYYLFVLDYVLLNILIADAPTYIANVLSDNLPPAYSILHTQIYIHVCMWDVCKGINMHKSKHIFIFLVWSPQLYQGSSCCGVPPGMGGTDRSNKGPI